MADQNDKKRGRILLEEPEIDLPEVKKLREDLLNNFEDDDDLCTTSQDLDSFMKSFEEQISAPAPAADSGDLGFLLEASDDELGLPPPSTEAPVPAAELVRVESDSSGLSELWEFEDQMANFDSFDFGSTGNVDGIDGLFDYSDTGFGSGEFGCQPETLPAQ
ncbi:hypothetical protein LIER_06250 [Lithospermum erythrorhizon]|uniref:Uncharacterized protein n=1 Tax=Lithospermum erythrorhizon TaxID=34254 RepID=A0AAV3P4U4_LITER